MHMSLTMVDPKALSQIKVEGVDYSDLDLSNADLSRSIFRNCKFDRANMSHANCEFSDFIGSSFKDTNCYYTSFKRSKLAGTLFEPKDAYGMTMTYDCKTFENMRLGQLWWYSWLMLIASTQPSPALSRSATPENLKDKLMALIGTERYIKLRSMLQGRQL